MSTAQFPATDKSLVEMSMHLIKGELHLLSSSDDHDAIIQQVLATHAPDGRDVNVMPLLRIVEDVLQHSKPTVLLTPRTHSDEEVQDPLGVVALFEALAGIINTISREIEFRCFGGGDDAQAATMHVFDSLSSFGWDAKAVLALAAFAVSYGEFWLVAQFHNVDPLAKSLAILKQIPDILEHSEILRPQFNAVNNLINAMLDIAKCIVEFKDLSSDYDSLELSDMVTATAHIPTAVYWMIRGAVVCSSTIIGIISLGHEYISSTSEAAWEISSLAHKIRKIHGHLTKQLDLCHQRNEVSVNILLEGEDADDETAEEEKGGGERGKERDDNTITVSPDTEEQKNIESYNTLVRRFETNHVDNMTILRELVYSPDDLPLVDGRSKKRVSLDVLRRKIVMLLITDLDISHEELFVLTRICNDDRRYEIVWLPLIDRHAPLTPSEAELLDRIVPNMPWYYLHHPSVLTPASIKYVRDVWGFDKKPVLAVLDAQGKVVCPNAVHMLWIWGNRAFPFTGSREEALWKEETWRLEFLVDEIDPEILTWIREGRHVCLYGGDDVDWIREFTTLLRRVCRDASVPLETVYIGKSSPKERVRKATAAISAEQLSGYWRDPAAVWFFWARLESMLYSKMKQHAYDDPIMREVVSLLSFDSGDDGWALISRGSTEMVKANGKKLVDCLMQFDVWKEDAEQLGFVPALRNALVPFDTHEHCTRLVLTGGGERVEEEVVCAECKRPMEKFVLYRCCND